MRRAALRLLAAVLCATVRVAAATDENDPRPEVVPYRPTVSTPAALSAPGWLEAELGGLYVDERHADDGPVRRGSLPWSLKYAFSDDWGVRLDGEALVHADFVDGGHALGFGDTGLVLKRRFAVDAASAFGAEVGLLAPTARRGLEAGSGKPDWSVNAIYSGDLDAWHTDVNVVNTRVGTRIVRESRLQTLGAWSVSRSIAERWTFAGEVSGTHRRGASGTAQALGAVSYALRRDIVVDIGAARGLNRASPTWEAFTGLTVAVGRS